MNIAETELVPFVCYEDGRNSVLTGSMQTTLNSRLAICYHHYMPASRLWAIASADDTAHIDMIDV